MSLGDCSVSGAEQRLGNYDLTVLSVLISNIALYSLINTDLIAYTFLYGGILGQEIANVTERDSDVSLAVEVSA